MTHTLPVFNDMPVGGLGSASERHRESHLQFLCGLGRHHHGTGSHQVVDCQFQPTAGFPSNRLQVTYTVIPENGDEEVAAGARDVSSRMVRNFLMRRWVVDIVERTREANSLMVRMWHALLKSKMVTRCILSLAWALKTYLGGMMKKEGCGS